MICPTLIKNYINKKLIDFNDYNRTYGRCIKWDILSNNYYILPYQGDFRNSGIIYESIYKKANEFIINIDYNQILKQDKYHNYYEFKKPLIEGYNDVKCSNLDILIDNIYNIDFPNLKGNNIYIQIFGSIKNRELKISDNFLNHNIIKQFYFGNSHLDGPFNLRNNIIIKNDTIIKNCNEFNFKDILTYNLQITNTNILGNTIKVERICKVFKSNINCNYLQTEELTLDNESDLNINTLLVKKLFCAPLLSIKSLTNIEELYIPESSVKNDFIIQKLEFTNTSKDVIGIEASKRTLFIHEIINNTKRDIYLENLYQNVQLQIVNSNKMLKGHHFIIHPGINKIGKK